MNKSMDWFLYDNDLRHERVTQIFSRCFFARIFLRSGFRRKFFFQISLLFLSILPLLDWQLRQLTCDKHNNNYPGYTVFNKLLFRTYERQVKKYSKFCLQFFLNLQIRKKTGKRLPVILKIFMTYYISLKPLKVNIQL